jgi:hypothetical protein
MTIKNAIPGLLICALFFTGCATTTLDTEIITNPPGATVTIDGLQSPEITPFKYPFDFSSIPEHKLLFAKDGFFEQELLVNRNLPSLSKGEVAVTLIPSPLWEATTTSPATNAWVQVPVGADLDARNAWQIMIDAVIKRSSNVKELNYESGYLQTKYTVKKFETKNGEFLLRCQLIATLVSSEPLIYRIKDVAEWSGNGVQWYPYNRIFHEHAEMIIEIQDRLRSN